VKICGNFASFCKFKRSSTSRSILRPRGRHPSNQKSYPVASAPSCQFETFSKPQLQASDRADRPKQRGRLWEYEHQVLGAEQLVIPERVAFEAEDPEPCGSSSKPSASILRIAAPPPAPSQRIVVIEDELEPATLPAPRPDQVNEMPEADQDFEK
jgi:hypothetical protein